MADPIAWDDAVAAAAPAAAPAPAPASGAVSWNDAVNMPAPAAQASTAAPSSFLSDMLMNGTTGLVRGASYIGPSMPDAAVRLGDRVGQYLENKVNGTDTPYSPGTVTQLADKNLITPEDVQGYLDPHGVANYVPQTKVGEMGQAALSALPGLAVGGGSGLLNVGKAALPAVTGSMAAKEASDLYPDNPLAPLAAGILGGGGAALGQNVGGNLLRTGVSAVAPTMTADANALRFLSKAVGAGDATGNGAEGLSNFISNSPVPMTLADSPNAQIQALAGSVARNEGGREAATSFLNSRDQAAPEDLKAAISDNISPAANSYQAAQALTAQQKAAAAPLYEKAFAGGSIAPLESQFEDAFNQAGGAQSAAQEALRAAQQRLTIAQGQAQTNSNVYVSAPATDAVRSAQADVEAGQNAVAQAAQQKQAMLTRLQQAQQDRTANAPGAVWNPRIQQFLDDPIIQQGIGKGLQIQRLEALAQNQPFNPSEYAVVGTNADGSPMVGSVPNMRLLDAAKRGLDDIVENYRDPTTGKLQLDQYGNAVNQVRASFLKELDAVNPDYSPARAAWSGPAQSKSAISMGSNFAYMKPDQITDALAGLSPADQQNFRLGMASTLNDTVDKTAMNAGNEAARIANSTYRQNQIKAAFDNPQQAQQFMDQVSGYNRQFQTKQAVLGNSATAGRYSADLQNAGGPEGISAPLAAEALLSHGPTGAAAVLGANVLKNALRGTPLNTPTAAKLAGILYNPDPQANLSILSQATQKPSGAFGFSPGPLLLQSDVRKPKGILAN